MRRLRIMAVILGLLSGITSTSMIKVLTSYGDQYHFDSILNSRPTKNQSVFDYAHLLQYSKENKEESLKFFREKYGIDMVVATVPTLEGQDIVLAATTMLNNWNIGRENGGKGILILLADQEKLIKVEVGLEAEGIFTDLFCGYIERKQLKPYFENNQVDLGLSATLEEFIGRAEGRLTDEEIKTKMKIDGDLSAGAGIKKEISIGEL